MSASLVPLPPAADQMLDLDELSILLKRSIGSLYRDIAAGRIPRGVKIGRFRRWLRSEIAAWLEAGAPSRKEWEARKAARA